MDRLNERMTDVYGHRWTSSYSRRALDTWAIGLAGLSTRQIAAGVGACVAGTFAWPPTLPEFRGLCLAPAGMPTPDQAWSEARALAAKWKRPDECTHPAIWHAYSETSGLSTLDEEVGRKRFLRAYDISARMYAEGKAMQPIPEALPVPAPKAPMTNEQRAAMLAEVDRKLAGLRK